MTSGLAVDYVTDDRRHSLERYHSTYHVHLITTGLYKYNFKQSISHIDFNDHLMCLSVNGNFVSDAFELMFVILDYRECFVAWLFLSVK